MISTDNGFSFFDPASLSWDEAQTILDASPLVDESIGESLMGTDDPVEWLRLYAKRYREVFGAWPILL